MGADPKRISMFINFIPFLSGLIKLAQVYLAGGTNEEKHAAVQQAATGALIGGASAVAANNPAYADLISQNVSAMIPQLVDSLKANGEMPAAPELVIPPAPPTP